MDGEASTLLSITFTVHGDGVTTTSTVVDFMGVGSMEAVIMAEATTVAEVIPAGLQMSQELQLDGKIHLETTLA